MTVGGNCNHAIIRTTYLSNAMELSTVYTAETVTVEILHGYIYIYAGERRNRGKKKIQVGNGGQVSGSGFISRGIILTTAFVAVVGPADRRRVPSSKVWLLPPTWWCPLRPPFADDDDAEAEEEEGRSVSRAPRTNRTSLASGEKKRRREDEP